MTAYSSCSQASAAHELPGIFEWLTCCAAAAASGNAFCPTRPWHQKFPFVYCRESALALMHAGAARAFMPEPVCMQYHPAHLEHTGHAKTGLQ